MFQDLLYERFAFIKKNIDLEHVCYKIPSCNNFSQIFHDTIASYLLAL